MLKSKLKKRSHLIKGTPIRKAPSPHDIGRRGEHHVPDDADEYDVAYESFFEFQKDLDELEASNEQERRAAIYGTTTSGDVTNITEKKDESHGFIVMEEESEPKFNPVVMEDYEEVKAPPEFKRCLFVKTNGQRCKRQAPKKGTLCAAHRKK